MPRSNTAYCYRISNFPRFCNRCVISLSILGLFLFPLIGFLNVSGSLLLRPLETRFPMMRQVPADQIAGIVLIGGFHLDIRVTDELRHSLRHVRARYGNGASFEVVSEGQDPLFRWWNRSSTRERNSRSALLAATRVQASVPRQSARCSSALQPPVVLVLHLCNRAQPPLRTICMTV
jgi:hypothetical protein